MTRLAFYSSMVLIFFLLAAIYAPFLAASRPLFVIYEGCVFFPLFAELLYQGYYTKAVDIFFNIGIFTAPIIAHTIFWRQKWKMLFATVVHCVIFALAMLFPIKDPGVDPALNKAMHERLQAHLRENPRTYAEKSFAFEKEGMTPYAKVRTLFLYKMAKEHDEKLHKYAAAYATSVDKKGFSQDDRKRLPTPFGLRQLREKRRLEDLQGRSQGDAAREQEFLYIHEKQRFLEEESQKLSCMIMPLIRPFHWEDDAGGQQDFNAFLPLWELSRINRKDLFSGLIFGARISIVVGIVATALQLLIGVPLGAWIGYLGGRADMWVCRLLEIWEAMPSFFMLLLCVAMLQTKSIFLVICVLAFFGWTGFCRYVRGEVLKQKKLAYVEACLAMGYPTTRILFSHILPNALPPVVTLIPFAIMGAMSAEAGLSFIGLGEEGSASWGVLMDEGRQVFPGESYLLWPPAFILTIILVAIALLGDYLRDAFDPRLAKAS